MSTYKSIHTGERVDNAVTKIPESLPTEDSLIIVKSDGSASEYISQLQISSDKLDKTGGAISGNLTVQKKLKCETAPTENNDVLRYQDTAVEVETSLMGA